MQSNSKALMICFKAIYIYKTIYSAYIVIIIIINIIIISFIILISSPAYEPAHCNYATLLAV